MNIEEKIQDLSKKIYSPQLPQKITYDPIQNTLSMEVNSEEHSKLTIGLLNYISNLKEVESTIIGEESGRIYLEISLPQEPKNQSALLDTLKQEVIQFRKRWKELRKKTN